MARIPSRATRFGAFQTPNTLVRLWQREILKVMRETRSVIRELLTEEVLSTAVIREDALPIQIEQAFSDISLRFVGLFENPRLKRSARSTAKRAEKLGETQFKRLVGKGSIRPDVVRQATFIDNSIDRIRSLAENQLVETQKLIEQAGATGRSVKDLAKDIDKLIDNKARANLIARDQMLKLHGAIVKDKQTNAGITKYIWTTSGDQRVRDEHADLEGTEQSWNSPPITSEDGRQNHPGEDFQCRCIAYPVLDVLGDEFEAF